MKQKNYLEALESRRMLSIAVESGIVSVTGSSAFDHVLVSVSPSNPKQIRVNLNGFAQSFAKADLNGIVIDTKGGNDHIIVDNSYGNVSVPMTILGGAGADYIVGGAGDDSINGGSGKDRINAGAGDDSVSGGASRDLISGGVGDDTISGGAGDDAINGGDGNDVESGGAGDDVVTGDAGSDLITGGADSDQLEGDTGADTLSGGTGDDELDGGAAADSLTGGTGEDAFAADATSTDTIVDKTSGTDRVYTPFSLDQIPQKYQDLFHATFHNSSPLGVQVNDDQTFTMLYQYNGDGTQYHAFFTFSGSDPFADLESVSLLKYEIAPANIPVNTMTNFRDHYPDATIKEVYADHDGDIKFAMIRIKDGDADSKWVQTEWLDNE